jgi:NADH-quinone oxidoreductase subunit N
MLGTLAQVQMPEVDWAAISPLIVLFGGAAVLLMLSGLLPKEPFRGAWAWLTVLVAVGTAVAAITQWGDVTGDGQPRVVLARTLYLDGFSIFLTVVISIAVIFAALFSEGYQRREGIQRVEPYVLILLSASGGWVMATSIDLIVTFLGLEILSIAVYVLAASHQRRTQSQEAGMKYFILGAFSSAFFLYGIALVYGSTGSTNLGRILGDTTGLGGQGQIPAFADGTPALFLAGLGLLLVGFGFKIAAVPFHIWTPDVYQGSPSPAVVYMASGVKAAGFAGLLRVFSLALGPFQDDWAPFIFALSVLSLVVGAVLAVVQSDVKRMLAYSSISHAGFILLGVEAASREGVAGALFYLVAYTFMVAGSFGVVTVVAGRGDRRNNLSDYRGLARSQPLLAFCFTVLLLAQAGVPLTAGFFAKFYVLEAAIEAGSWPLALIAMISAVIAAFLYLRIIVSMYMAGGDEAAVEPAAPARLRVPVTATIGLVAAVAFTLVVGVFPSRIAGLSDDASFDVVPAQTEASP